MPSDGDACDRCGVWLTAFDPSRAPAPLRGLLGPARQWGISDDGYRGRMVSTASRADLEAMVGAVDSVDIDLVDGWLAGPEADAEEPSIEYVAVSALCMAADHARFVL